MMRYRRINAEINLDAILQNIEEQKKLLAPGTKIMAVVKADGYGHGAVPVARELDQTVHAFAVSSLEEALELRHAGICRPILILSYTSPYCYEEIINNNITQTVYTLDMAKALSETAQRMDQRVNIHIALDTGMTRIGFFANDESVETIRAIAALPFLRITGLFTHYAKADEADKTVARRQTAQFCAFAEKLEAAGVSIPCKHISNSAGILEFSEHFDMVRMGISLYGLYPSDEVSHDTVKLTPAMRLLARVISIKDVDAGCGVSYGHAYITDRPTKVATVSVGYADGYPRILSNRGRVLIKGQYAPIIGRICMDQMMIDVTDIKGEVKIEDKVILIGRDGENEITADDIARLEQTINYEVICNISRRVPRIYFRNGERVETISYLMRR